MRFAAAALLGAASLLAACTDGSPSNEAAASPAAGIKGWQPRPVAGAPEPSEVVEKASANAWRTIDPANLLVMEFKDGGRVVIELAPAFAPIHIENVRKFARAGWWNGSAIYRVQDNYVAQWGNGDAKTALPAGVVRQPAAEHDRPLAGLAVRPLGYPDSYAPMVGHAESWPIGYDPEAGRAWLTHCYGMVGVGRDLAPDTGTGGELYAIIGHAPRHLDLNIAVIGRVIEGIERLSARPRGTEALGFYKDTAQHVPIAAVRLASDMPAAARPAFEVLRSDQDAFGQFVTGRANRGGDFFQRPAGGVDLCNVPVPVRTKSG